MSREKIGKVALTPKGAYNSTTQYESLDVITHSGKAYVVLSDVKGITPSNDGAKYQLLVSDGHTPQKGTDYWTDDDVASVVADVTEQSKAMVMETLAYACKVENTKPGRILYEYKIVAGNKYKVTNNGTSYLNVRTLDGSGTDVDILPTTAAGKSTVFIATKDAVTFSLYFGAAGSAEIEDLSLRVPIAEEKIANVENIIRQSYRQSESGDFKWVIGSIEFNSGKDNNTNTNRIRTGFIPVTGVGCTVTLEGDGRFCVWEYASNDVEGCISDYEVTNANWISGQYTIKKDDCRFIRIAAKKTDDSGFDDDSLAEFGTRFKITQVFNTHRAVGRYVSPVKESFHYEGALEDYSLDNKLETIYAKWDELTESYPNIITKKVLGNVGGKEIRSYTITPTPLYSTYSIASNSCEPLKILYISSIHGSEGAIALDDFALFKNLVVNHKPSILWSNCIFEIIPVANPVGYDANDRLNGNGININRNFPDGWTFVDAEEDWYNASGNEPCSEYETRLLMDFVKSHSDAFLVMNRHGTDPWGIDGLAGYAASKYQSDIETIIASHSATDTMLRDMYDLIDERNPNRRAYSVLHSNNFAGTFDRWFNSIGYHGYLLEFNDRTTDDPYNPNETVRRMNIAAIANLLCDSVLNNRGILGNNNILTSHYE